MQRLTFGLFKWIMIGRQNQLTTRPFAVHRLNIVITRSEHAFSCRSLPCHPCVRVSKKVNTKLSNGSVGIILYHIVAIDHSVTCM